MKKLIISKNLLLGIVAVCFCCSCQNDTPGSRTAPSTPAVEEKKEEAIVKTPASYEAVEPLKNLQTSDLIYAWVDKLNVRDKASPKGKVITSVDSKDALEFSGTKSGAEETIVLRGKAYEDLWYKIKTNDGMEGWVYGGAVKRKDEQKGNAAITDTKFDFPHFGNFDLSTWKKTGTKREGEEVDNVITTYQKGNRILEVTNSDMGEMFYGHTYRLMDANKRTLKSRYFGFSGVDENSLIETVKDYTTEPAKEYSREQPLKKHFYHLNARPVMVNRSWTEKNIEIDESILDGIMEEDNSAAVKVNFKQKVQGYEVSAVWNPDHQRAGHAMGDAIVTFTKGNTSFKVKNEFFGLPVDQIDAEYDDMDRIKNLKTENINFDYKEHKINGNKIGYPDVPFLFLDVDFDGKKDLLLCKRGQGNRGRTIFDVYDAEGTMKTGKPYDIFDGETKIDMTNKELNLFASGGACASNTYTYKLMNTKLQLTKVLKQNIEGENCMESTYEVTNGNEKFISKRVL